MIRILSTVISSVLFCSLPGFAETLVPTISGNELTARIELAGGVTADLTITFENIVGLNPAALALSASAINPTDLAFLARMPDPSVSIPAGFPIVVRIEPTASSALSFEGVYKLSLYTHNLTFAANSPLRLYRAPQGGAFSDMTGFLQAGSVRAGGSGPGFSEFVIVGDARAVDSVIASKFDALQGQLTASSGAISPAAASDLQQRLTQARAAYDDRWRLGLLGRSEEAEWCGNPQRVARERGAGQCRGAPAGRRRHAEVQPRFQVEPDPDSVAARRSADGRPDLRSGRE